MKKNGFVFIETIIAIVVLTTSLLLLYSTFTKLLQSEKTRVYYDDVAYVYRTWYIKNELKDLNFSFVTDELRWDNCYITIGTEYDGLFVGYENQKDYITSLLSDYDVNQIVLLKENKIDNLRECFNSNSCGCDNNFSSDLSDGLTNYIKNLSVDVYSYYILVIEYKTCDSSNHCKNYYSWVGV